MGYEIELKAHVSDYQSVRSRIQALHGVDAGISEHKADIYWSLPSGGPLFRVREESTGDIDGSPDTGILLFTRKDKQLQGEIEVNHEIEFTAPLEDAASVHEFFCSLGYVEYVRKEKTGWAWHCPVTGPIPLPSVHIELVDVSTLGWFLEMECVLDDVPSSAQLQAARSSLLYLLDALGVPSTAIEERYYMDLLLESKKQA